MTKKNDPEIERQVQGFMYEVGRRDRILRLCKKPTTCERYWEGGRRALVQEVLEVMEESLGREHTTGRILHDMLDVLRAALEAGHVDDVISDWLTETADALAWPAGPSGY